MSPCTRATWTSCCSTSLWTRRGSIGAPTSFRAPRSTGTECSATRWAAGGLRGSNRARRSRARRARTRRSAWGSPAWASLTRRAASRSALTIFRQLSSLCSPPARWAPSSPPSRLTCRSPASCRLSWRRCASYSISSRSRATRLRRPRRWSARAIGRGPTRRASQQRRRRRRRRRGITAVCSSLVSCARRNGPLRSWLARELGPGAQVARAAPLDTGHDTGRTRTWPAGADADARWRGA
mmetsp:Transcript_5193/g.13644  ORF Transcript_5193/g.13644 Transcript_5193/m.13644 type:complete len:239 (-) Transcript_5193:235-951(-)